MLCFFGWLVGWFVGFYGISTFIAKSIFYVNNLFFWKQFSLALVHGLMVKNISISNYSSSYM